MMSFNEYAARRQKMTLPSPATMLTLLGIDPHGPHDVEVMRMTKAMKKAADQAHARAKSRFGVARTIAASSQRL